MSLSEVSCHLHTQNMIALRCISNITEVNMTLLPVDVTLHGTGHQAFENGLLYAA